MLQNVSPTATAAADTRPDEVPGLLDPHSPIEVASSGTGGINDTGPDTRPPLTAGDDAVA